MLKKIAAMVIMMEIMVTGIGFYKMETYNRDTDYTSDIMRMISLNKERYFDGAYENVAYGRMDTDMSDLLGTAIAVDMYDDNDNYLFTEFVERYELKTVNEIVNCEFVTPRPMY